MREGERQCARSVVCVCFRWKVKRENQPARAATVFFCFVFAAVGLNLSDYAHNLYLSILLFIKQLLNKTARVFRIGSRKRILVSDLEKNN